jgi:hypothetical protein
MIAKHSRRRKQSGIALLVALFALLLLSAIGMGMMFSANTETNVNANYREKQMAIYAALAGGMEVKDRLTSTGDITVPAGLPAVGVGNVLYIINPKSGETVAPWLYSNKYYDTELCHDNVMGLTGTYGVQCPQASTSFPAGTAWYTTRDNSSVGYTGVFKLNPPLDYKWARVQLKANNTTNFPADGSTSNAGQVCWNGMNQIPRPAGYGVDCVPNGSLTAITLTSGGAGYSSPPVVHISAPPAGGTQATATTTVGNPTGALNGIVIDTGGSGYITPPTVTIGAPASGTTATATATVVGVGSPVTSLTINNTGTPTACWTDAAAPGAVVSLNFSNLAGGLGATGTATLTSGYNCIAALNFTSGTCSAPDKNVNATLAVSSGGSGFAANAHIPSNGHLNQATINVTNPGTGYTSTTPTVAITVGAHTGSCVSVAATATLGHTLSSVTLTNGGGGYTSSPAIGFAATITAGGVPSITANLGSSSPGAVVAITLTNAGSGYTSAPSVTISGGCAGSPSVCTTNATAHSVFSGAVQTITITDPGAGYTSPPSVWFTGGGGGTGAAATATTAAGTYFAPIYLITALGYSPAGARAMVQIEAAPAIRALNMPGALTLAGPQPIFGAPNSNNFMIDGTDHPTGYVDTHGNATAPTPAGCASTTSPPHPSIGVYDDPNSPTSPSSVSTVLTDIPSNRLSTNYPGLNASPDVQNVYGALGDQGTTPSGMDSIVSAVSALPGATVYTGNQTDSSVNLGSSNGATPPVISNAIDVVYGDVTFNGNTNGYGILVVTGTLTFRGNMSWNGIVLVIGKGNLVFSGGGSGTINGSVLVAKTKDSSGNELTDLGVPTMDWSGGGGNGIYYDHCYSDGLLNMIPMTVPVSTKPLTILSIKTLPY